MTSSGEHSFISVIFLHINTQRLICRWAITWIRETHSACRDIIAIKTEHIFYEKKLLQRIIGKIRIIFRKYIISYYWKSSSPNGWKQCSIRTALQLAVKSSTNRTLSAYSWSFTSRSFNCVMSYSVRSLASFTDSGISYACMHGVSSRILVDIQIYRKRETLAMAEFPLHIFSDERTYHCEQNFWKNCKHRSCADPDGFDISRWSSGYFRGK